jgi:hypothetical protein
MCGCPGPPWTTEIEACVVVLPVTVIKITGKQDKSDALINCEFNQVVEGAASSAANFLYGGTVIALQAMEGAVEVDVCRVNIFQQSHIRRSSRNSDAGSTLVTNM